MQEIPGLHDFVYAPEMVDFVTSANAYCHFLENLQGTGGREFIERSVPLLAGVYSRILLTGDTEPGMESTVEPTVTEQEWSAIYRRISMLLGEYNAYLLPAEEQDFDRSDLVTHTVSEDMADVYQELKDFVTSYGLGLEELMNDAAWEVKERFGEHWGKKLLHGLSALHRLFVDGIDPEGTEGFPGEQLGGEI